MFQELINKEVVCNDISIIQFMYPTFKLAKDKFCMYFSEPFIYIGDYRNIPIVKDYDVPHIIVSSTGEYNLNDRDTLINLAYKKHNKRIPQYIAELLGTWTNEQFRYNWKHLWVHGTIPSEEVEQNKMFFDILDNIENSYLLLSTYIKSLPISDLTNLEDQLINFISNSMENKESKYSWYQKCQKTFKSLYGKNVPHAVSRLLHNSNPSPALQNLSLLIDITVGNK